LPTSNLDKIFNPKNVALIGASEKEGSVGFYLMKNLIELDFKGDFYPINIKKKDVLGHKTYENIEQVPDTIDLAIIATPAKTVPDLVEQCGKKGVGGLVIISAGFREIGKEGKELEEKIIQISKKYGIRIIGPNCLGFIRPSINLNATFSPQMPKTGNVAFISQSGALGTAILDWATHENIGFSNFVSLGSMSDVDFADLIDYFGSDPLTRSILMYVEGLREAKKFMSAARHFARSKPIIVVKSGRFEESAKAAASHTGSLAGSDMVYDAAFKRAGIIRVQEISDLFNSAEVLAMQPLPQGPNIAIITNAGGPGVMATDAIISNKGNLAQISNKTLSKIDKILPPYWSKANPIDLLGDASAERYSGVIDACLDDKNIDGLLIIYTPQGKAKPVDIARSIVDLVKKKKVNKTILTSFIGYERVSEAVDILIKNNIPTYQTPEQAVKTYMYMYQYKRNLELLYETPIELDVDSIPPKRPINMLIKNALKQNRDTLTEYESKKLIEYYNLPVVKTRIAKNSQEAVMIAREIGFPVVMKILSPQIIHKTDAGGVFLNINSEEEVEDKFTKIIENAKNYDPKAEIQGVTIQQMVAKKGYEVILGANKDPLFGPIILFGMGGIGVELFKDVSAGIPPLNETLTKRIMEDTIVYRLLKGYRNLPPANITLLNQIMVKFSKLLVDFPQIKEIDLNPLFVDENEVIVIDARVIIDKESHSGISPEHLIITPYPRKYESLWTMRNGKNVFLRPIKPEDEPLWLDMFKSLSEESIRFRFFEILRDTPHEVIVRYCNIDYDRELAIVPEVIEKNKRKIAGVVRLIIEPDGKTGEVAVLVADPWQGIGLGSKLVDYMIEICKEKKLEKIYAEMLYNNIRVIRILAKMGFIFERVDQETVRGTLNLKEED
jgi:acetyltransferase